MKIDAYHLPALRRPPTTTWSYDREGDYASELRIPRLTPQLLNRQIDGLLEAREAHLADRPVGQVIEAIDVVARRLLDRSDPLREGAESGLVSVTGMSPQMAIHVLDGMAADWRGERLEELLLAEMGNPDVLDGFASRPGSPGRTRAFGPELVVHIFSGNVAGVSVTSLIRALLVKAASLGKTAAGEPVLAPLFARGLAEVDAALGRCIAVTYWPGGEAALESCALQRADAVIGYGGREAITVLRDRTPVGIPFLGYGHKVSFGVICSEAISDDDGALTREAALAVATFDQQGCVSPHLFYVEGTDDGAIREWAHRLAGEMARLEEELPRGGLAPGEAAAIRQLRGEIEFASISGRGHELFASPGGTAWTVIFDPEPGFTPSCLNRVIRIRPVRSLEEVVEETRGLSGLVQTVGAAGPEERIGWLAARMGRIGASRVSPISSMAWPAPTWHHDGRPPLGDLVRWCDME